MRRKYRDLDVERSDLFLPWKRLPRPIDWARAFSRSAPLELEIGFGNGEYLAEVAEDTPQHDFIGVEAKLFRLERALQHLEDKRVENVRLLLCDARVALERLVQPKALEKVHSLFCDPWPKKKHIKYRLFSNDFLKLMNSRLARGGEAFLVTDDQPYFLWILEELPGTGFEVRHKLAPPRHGTKFERKWRRERGQREFYEVLLEKRRHIERPVKRDIELSFPEVPCFDFERFQPGRARGDAVVQFRKKSWDASAGEAQAVAVAVDGPLTQIVRIKIIPENSSWRVALANEEDIVPTPAVQKALDLAAAGCR